MSETFAAGWHRQTVRKGTRRGLLAVATALILTALAPWHTGDLPWLERAVQFATATLVWELAVAAVAGQARRWFDAAWLDTPLGLVATAMAASLPATTVLAALLLCAGSRPGQIPIFYVQSLLLGVVIAFVRRGFRQGVNRPARARTDAEAPHGSKPDMTVAFLRRHTPALAGKRLRALQAEDHYVRIHTDGGSELVLLRMRDAMAELGDEAGWQPHRSFWLAADAGGNAIRRGQAWQIVLDTGLTVPVSKSAAPAMHAAGYTPKASPTVDFD